MTFRVFKPRKAKFGFISRLASPDDIIHIGNVLTECKQTYPGQYFVEVDTNMTKSEVRVYSDSEDFAKSFPITTI